MRLLYVLIALAVVLALMVFFAKPASAAPASFFGMHDHAITLEARLPEPINSVRLWDNGTTWRDIEVSPGVYNWAPLDAAVANAEARNDSVSLVLGGTPRFWADDPNSPGGYGPGFCSSANLDAWKRYVTAVVTRYKGRIGSYEPINEADIHLFYCSGPAHLEQRSKIVYNTVQRIDPAAIVTSPSFVDRLASSQYYMLRYLTEYNGAKYAEVYSYHPYGMPDYTPEQNSSLIRSLRAKLAKRGILKPVWTTEINYGLPIGGGGTVSGDWNEWKQSAFLARTWLTQYDAGARRVYWYAWSDAPFLGVKIFGDTGERQPVRVLSTVKRWMSGHVKNCSVSSRNVWSCPVSYPGRDGVIRWSPSGTRYVPVPAGSLTKQNMYGKMIPLNKYVGIAPVLYR